MPKSDMFNDRIDKRFEMIYFWNKQIEISKVLIIKLKKKSSQGNSTHHVNCIIYTDLSLKPTSLKITERITC